MEESTIDHDVTDNVRLTVTEEIHETLVDFHDNNKIGEKCNLSENFIESVVKIVIIDADDYEEDLDKPDQYRFVEIWHNIQPLTNIYEIKQNLAKDLSLVNIDVGSFSDFNLGCMSSFEGGEISVMRFSESEKSIHSILEKSMPLYYLALLLLDYVYEHTENAQIKKLLKHQHEYLQNVRKVLENALEVNEWSVPDLETIKNRFNRFKARLPSLGDEYLRSVPELRFSSASSEGSGLKLLCQHKQLVINYEIVNEVEYAISCLHDVLGTIKEEVLGDENKSFGVYAEVTKSSTTWTVNGESEVRNYYA